MRFIIPDEQEGPSEAPIEPSVDDRTDYLTNRRLCPCGRMFTPYRSFQRYCCDAHRVKYSKGKESTYVKRPVVELKCAECGVVFKTNDSKRHYCSKACYDAAQLKRHVPQEERRCMVCGKVFTTSHWLKRYCSKACRDAARRSS